jgi:hypothetical protein
MELYQFLDVLLDSRCFVTYFVSSSVCRDSYNHGVMMVRVYVRLGKEPLSYVIDEPETDRVEHDPSARFIPREDN